MGVGLHLSGSTQQNIDRDAWFRSVWSRLLQELPDMALWAAVGEDNDGNPHIKMQLHPAAQPITIMLTDERSIQCIASTNAVGPGYHLFLCDLIHQMGRWFSINWKAHPPQDKANNPAFFSSNPNEAYDEMLAWARANAVNTISLIERGCTKIQWSMHSEYVFDHDRLIATAMGPRDAAWLQSVLEEPRNSTDIFPWWTAGRDSEYLLGRAVYLMWNEVRWRPPLDETEANFQQSILRLLSAAYRKNASLIFPWHEWAQLIEYCEFEDHLTELVLEHANTTPVPELLIGYRRRYLTTEVAGWRLRIPGSCADHYDDESGAFLFWDDQLQIQLVAFEPGLDGAPVPIGEFNSLGDKLGDVVQENTRDNVHRRIYTSTSSAADGVWRFTAVLMVPGCVALVHVLTPNRGNLDWSIEFFNSITHTGGLNKTTTSIGDPARRVLSDLQAIAPGTSQLHPINPEYN